MTDQPLVSVITPTWGRPHTILRRAVAAVAGQTYPELEHLIVTDGHDEDLCAVLRGAGYGESHTGARRLVCLGRNWTQPYANGSNGAIARLVGTYLARGEIIGVLDDDNWWDEDHVDQMVARFAETGADMVCSDFHHLGRMISSSPPRTGNIDTSSFMYRWQALMRSNWAPDGYECDGHLAERLVAAGCSWAVKPSPTLTITEQRHGAPD